MAAGGYSAADEENWEAVVSDKLIVERRSRSAAMTEVERNGDLAPAGVPVVWT